MSLSTLPIWDDLVAAALLGTERRAAPLPTTADALGALLAALPADDPAAALLGAAAATALAQRAGALPEPSGTPSSVALSPPEQQPACPPRAAGHLAQMLAGSQRAALPEWLAALAASGRVAPPALLPALLERGIEDARMRKAIAAVVGARGRWLAGLNPAWDYARAASTNAVASGDPAVLWETGSLSERLSALYQLREHDPERARTLLAASWTTEKADDRAAFLAAIAAGLSSADELFLERALDDRAERVRKVAANLLMALPASALRARLVARVAPLLRWTPESTRLLKARPPALDVELPEEYDQAMQRDGIIRRPINSALGERAWWLQQMLALIPPATWCERWGAAPAAIVGARMPKEWRALLLASWSEAARRHADQTWIEALIALGQRGEKIISLSELLPSLPAARREQLAQELLRDDGVPLDGEHPALAILRVLPGPWSPTLAQGVLGALRRRLGALDLSGLRSDWHLRSAIDQFALRLPAALAADAAAIWPAELREWPYWSSTINEFDDMLHFRREMLAALDA